MSPVSARGVVGHRRRGERGVARVGAGDHADSAAPRRATVRGERTDLIERRRERDQAVARDAAVGRLEPDDAAERGRLADRAAGVGAERERHQPAATAAAEPPLDPPGDAIGAHGLRVGPNAEFSVDEPIANSSQLVLPMMTAPAASRRSTTVASYGGT